MADRRDGEAQAGIGRNASGALAGASQTLALDTVGFNWAIFYATVGGSLNGTLRAEATWDDGGNWHEVELWSETAAPFQSTEWARSTGGVADTDWDGQLLLVRTMGADQVRLFVQAFTSGTTTFEGRGWVGPQDPMARLNAGAIRARIAGSSGGVITATNEAIQATGDEAHDAADAGNPIKIGGKASSGVPTSVANGDRVDGWFELQGQQAVFLVDDAGNLATIASVGAGTALIVDGAVGHDAVDAGSPIGIGGRGVQPFAQPPEVSATNDRVRALFDRNGYQRVRGEFDIRSADINDAASGDNTIVAAAGAGKRIAVFSILIVADGTVDVRWEDGAAGTAFTGQVPLQAREGYAIGGGMNPLFVGAANTLLNLELSAAINVHGFVSYSVMDD